MKNCQTSGSVTALRRVTPDIFYYKTRAGREVDFIAQQQDRSRLLAQVCESMAELKLAHGSIVTRGEEEQIEVESGRIDVVPPWRFLLNLQGSALSQRHPAPW